MRNVLLSKLSISIKSKNPVIFLFDRGIYEDSKLIDTLKPTAANQGTQIIVEDLFYNMNIRKRALKSAVEEYQRITDVVQKYAIHNANVGMSCYLTLLNNK